MIQYNLPRIDPERFDLLDKSKIGKPECWTRTVNYEKLVWPKPEKGITVVFPIGNDEDCYWFDEAEQRRWNLLVWWRKYDSFLLSSMILLRYRDKKFTLWNSTNFPIVKGYDGFVTLTDEEDRLARLCAQSNLDIVYKPKLLCPEKWT